MAKIKLDQKEMMSAGLHLGHRTSKLHPHMEDFVVGIRSTAHVIDLSKTESYLAKALEEIEKLAKEKAVVLFVSTKAPLRGLVRQIAQELNMPYVVERWLGGTFTNFTALNQRAKYYQKLKKEKAEGALDKYTKKERIQLNRDFQKMANKFEGVVNLEKLPEAIFLCDIVKDHLPLKEARAQQIKSFAIIDSNGDPLLVDYPIPGNDDAISAVKYILEKVKEAILKAKT